MMVNTCNLGPNHHWPLAAPRRPSGTLTCPPKPASQCTKIPAPAHSPAAHRAVTMHKIILSPLDLLAFLIKNRPKSALQTMISSLPGKNRCDFAHGDENLHWANNCARGITTKRSCAPSCSEPKREKDAEPSVKALIYLNLKVNNY